MQKLGFDAENTRRIAKNKENKKKKKLGAEKLRVEEENTWALLAPRQRPGYIRGKLSAEKVRMDGSRIQIGWAGEANKT